MPQEALYHDPCSYDGSPPIFQPHYVVGSTARSVSSPPKQPTSSLDTLARVASIQSDDAGGTKELTAINQHTQSVEYYGSSSSMSLLSRVQGKQDASPRPRRLSGDDTTLVSELHNPAFFAPAPANQNPLDAPISNSQAHHQQCGAFLNSFFGSLHYIHPILNKSEFLSRCEKLRVGRPSSQAQSFMALYYSVLSLGALIGPRDEENSSTISNMAWSRTFFDRARGLCTELSMTTDLEMVQCFFFMVS